jgi:hypothetical protein
MSAVELALNKVRALNERQARKLLEWLDTNIATNPAPCRPLGIDAMIGFARRFNPEPKTTTEWMTELRAGDTE